MLQSNNVVFYCKQIFLSVKVCNHQKKLNKVHCIVNMRQKYFGKLVLFLLISCLIFFYCSMTFKQQSPLVSSPEISEISTSHLTVAVTNIVTTTEEVIKIWDEFKPAEVNMNEDIFLIESSGVGTLSPRQCCIVESALNSNIGRTVWVLISGANSTR